MAQVCKGTKSSWWDKTPEGFVERHKIAPCPPVAAWPVRRLKLVTLNAANEVVGVDYVRASGYSPDDFYAVVEALFIGDGEPLSDYW